MRISTFLALALTALAAGVGPAEAGYPERPISIIVPLPPGGPADTVARVIGQKLQERLGQPVTIDNKPGALGLIGAEVGARARPDGYTVVMVSSGLAIQIATQPKTVHFDFRKDLAPLTYAVKVPMVVAAGPATPFRTMEELVAQGKSKPGSLSIGVSPGLGGTAHLTLERMRIGLGFDVVPVPYKGSAPMMGDMLGNQIAAGVGSVPDFIENHKGGRIRVVAVLGTQRQAALPDVPTFAELGLAGFEDLPYYGIFAPAGTPKAVTDRFGEALAKVLAMTDVRNRLSAMGLAVGYMPQAQLASREQAYTKTWAAIIKASGFQPQ